MRTPRNGTTQSRLQELFYYDPATGVFTWKPDPTKKKAWNTRWAGRRAGYLGSDGHRYVQIFVDGLLYLGHRLAWLYVHGHFPPFGIDHIDGNPANNSILNLRPATAAQNLCNMKLKKNNTSGIKGVSWDASRGQWMAHIKHHGIRVFSKRFTTKQNAIDAVAAARVKFHGEFSNHGFPYG